MKPKVITYIVRVRAAAPQAVAIAAGLGQLYGRGINGRAGTVRYGYPGLSTQRAKYAGYVTPPQLFKGYTARRVAGGAIRRAGPRYPDTSAPVSAGSPLARAMATVSASQITGG